MRQSTKWHEPTLPQFWKTARGILNERVKIPYYDNMTFEEFALHESMQNYQFKSLGSTPIEGFDIVGVAESLESFVSKFIQIRGQSRKVKGGSLMHLNATPEYRSNRKVDEQSFIKKFKSLNELDYDVWNKAKLLNNIV